MIDQSSYSDNETNAPVIGELLIQNDEVYEIVKAERIACGGEGCHGPMCPGCWSVFVVEKQWIVA